MIEGVIPAPVVEAEEPLVPPTALQKASQRHGRSSHKSMEVFLELNELRAKERHAEVLQRWTDLQSSSPQVINQYILDLVVASSSKLGNSAFLLDAVDFALTLGIRVHQGTFLRYMKACQDDEKKGWTRAMAMLEVIKGTDVANAPLFEEVVTTCFNSGKWRRALDILHQMTVRKMSISDRLLNSAIANCAAIIDRAALLSAVQLFKLAVERGTPLKSSSYAALISGLSEGGMESDAEAVWRQMEASAVPLSDAVYAARILQLGHCGNADLAHSVVAKSLELKSSPKESISNMVNVLLKAGRVEEACTYLK
jgi:pentatricopeptide repeat protein